MRSRRFALPVLISASLVAVGVAAQAAPYVVSTKNRNFCCTNPPVFILGAPQAMNGYHTVYPGIVSQTGTGTPAIKVGMGQAARFFSRLSTYFGNGTFSVSNGSGTLQKNGGNLASFSFCPRAKGPGPGACTDPGQATPASFNGRIKVTPGPNRFGGTLQILAGPGGVGGNKFTVYRLLGGTFMSKLPAAIVHLSVPFAPIGASGAGYHVFGPGSFHTGFPTTGFMSMSYPDAGLSLHGAGRFTTGMVTLEISMFANPPVRTLMLTGYDDRTPAGLGDIQVVSGLVLNAAQPGSPSLGANVLGWKMRIHVVPEPGASLGLAAGALALLALGLLRAGSPRH
jgi:hypothetical protein